MADYWKDRLTHMQDVMFDRTAAEADIELGRLYKNMAANLRREIFDLFDKVDGVPLENILWSDIYRNNKYYEMLSRINEKLTALGLAEVKITEDHLLNFYEQTESTVPKLLGFDVSFDKPTEEVINKVWCPDGKNWSDRIWTNKALMMDNLERGIAECVTTGLSKDKVTNMVADVTGCGYRNAERLVRTELTHVQNEAAAAGYQKCGLDRYEFLAADDARTNGDICSSINGKVFRFADKSIGTNFPPMHPNCRCTILPVLEKDNNDVQN